MTGVTEKLFMCQIFMRLSWPQISAKSRASFWKRIQEMFRLETRAEVPRHVPKIWGPNPGNSRNFPEQVLTVELCMLGCCGLPEILVAQCC